MAAIKTFIVGLFSNIIAGLKAIFTKFSTIQWVSLLMTLASAVLAYGDTHQKLEGVPGWLAHDWPFVLALAAAFSKYGHIFFPAAKPLTADQVQQMIQDAQNKTP